ncbi:hypothetical protein NZ698_14885 [Chryseobacterium sp. PBS4-4]|uniref:Uncharacterized protein n=1 Tax=Chryseobacterium edaphi TaxID=2976532 RepID=A0ABT2WAL9_9FLAO|nr:hypothetical protein [Chryseobacterium edaphi]MCU7618484.1 hypothetical protein [Chryseobacterium edaphi]
MIWLASVDAIWLRSVELVQLATESTLGRFNYLCIFDCILISVLRAVENYEPYFVESLSVVDEDKFHYVLDVVPPRSVMGAWDEDFYFEMHLTTRNYPLNYPDFVRNYIHIHHINGDTIELFEGEFFEDSCSEEPFEYRSLEVKKFEKSERSEWKAKCIGLENRIRKVMSEKLPEYSKMRKKVVQHYQKIYENSKTAIPTFGLTEEMVEKPYLFACLFNLFNQNPYEDSLNQLIDSEYDHPKQIKSWKDQFDKLNIKFQNLQHSDVSDYPLVRDHMIAFYQRTFQYMMPSLLLNYRNVDEKGYYEYFNDLMTKLKETE